MPDTQPDDLAIREPPVVLLPLAVLEGQTVPEPLAAYLAPAEVIVLGYHVLPEQTPTEQASLQFEDRAREAVDDVAETFRGAGGDPETRVVFTHDRRQTIDRVADEVGATAVLIPNPTGAIEEVLVPIRGSIDDGRLADLIATLSTAGDARVTLWGVATEGSEFDPERAVERAAARLRDRGFDGARLATETSVTDAPLRDIVDRSAEVDVIAMREGAESIVGALLGDDAERVATGAVAPVLVLRDRPPVDAATEPTHPGPDADPPET
ncbi:universal stress protein [Halobellus rubicundus]|uniref:Universal stress protein n=1 Tax=Halobellus rubicundus TaxID=2996466 RepID=A0ABD5M6R7_9EURY